LLILYVQNSNSYATLFHLVDDCERFVLQSFDAMEASAPHIYHSAVPWCPKSSLIRVLYSDQLTTEAKVNAVDASWDDCIRTILVGGAVESLVFSHDGALMAISAMNCVKIFDAVTGVHLGTLDSHSRTVSVAFSLDDALLVHGSADGKIKVFDPRTSRLIGVFDGHVDRISSVAFSPCGTMIVSGSHDKTVRIWNLISDHCECVLEGHSGWVEAVCWSAKWNRVVPASIDVTVYKRCLFSHERYFFCSPVKLET
jgi:WD40 repeat protein